MSYASPRGKREERERKRESFRRVRGHQVPTIEVKESEVVRGVSRLQESCIMPSNLQLIY
jgi:hypothetical protein